MLISSPHKLNLCLDSQETCFLRNVFEAVQKTRSMSFIGSQTTQLRHVVLNPIKHSSSFFKHYIKCDTRKYYRYLRKPSTFRIITILQLFTVRCRFSWIRFHIWWFYSKCWTNFIPDNANQSINYFTYLLFSQFKFFHLLSKVLSKSFLFSNRKKIKFISRILQNEPISFCPRLQK